MRESSGGTSSRTPTQHAFCRTHARHTVVEGWLDLAKLVASEGSKSKGPYDDLAYKIGEQRGD